MIISGDQMDAFSQSSFRDFERRMIAHLNRFFPEQCSALGPPGVRNAIAYGIERAGEYGFVGERDVCKYIDLMFTFGRDFDKDPKHPWAARILTSTACRDSGQRMDALYEAAETSLRARAEAESPAVR